MALKKRTRKYTDSYVQGSLVRRILVHWCVFFVVTALFVSGLAALAGDPALPIAQRVGQQVRTVSTIAIVMLVLLPAFALDTIRFSNRFVGPIARLRKSLRSLAETGHADLLEFRDNDFWRESGAEFNEVVARFKALQEQADSTSSQQQPVSS